MAPRGPPPHLAPCALRLAETAASRCGRTDASRRQGHIHLSHETKVLPMNAAAMRETIAVGAITGMRSMAGPALLARRHGGVLSGVLPLMAVGEMVLDKTSVVGDRTDAVPLAGRALMGALVGGYIARQNRGHVLAGGIIGAATAVIAAHLAMRIRR